MTNREPVIPVYTQEFLDEWWATEPFGFDHPDTYNGILKLLNEAEARGRKAGLEEAAKLCDLAIQQAAKRVFGDNYQHALEEMAEAIRELIPPRHQSEKEKEK